MIITQNKSKEVLQSHDFEQVNCTIDAEDMRYVASLLRNNYSNTRLAVVREISANALDANAEANSDRKIEIKLPTKMNPSFQVRDFGGGLSQEDIFGLYSKYGKSTKRTSNNYIGAFGIGKFAPLSYGDNFTCTSYHNGYKTAYNIFVDENDDTKIVRLHEPELSNEPTGLCIGVAVADDDMNAFREVVQKFFKFFSEEDMPKFIGVEQDFIPTPQKLLSSKTDSWFFTEEKNSYYRDNKSHILMGRVAYPIDANAISVENHISDIPTRGVVENLLNQSNFYIRVPLGSVRLHHSRESLEYNKQTQKEICKVFYNASKEIQAIAKEKLADSEDLFEAKMNYAKVMNALPHQIQNVFQNSFEWNGMKIDSPRFSRDYKYQDEVVITDYEKQSDSSSRNGFKLSHTKTQNVYCTENILFLIQDLDSSHGNNLRVRTLMNENSSLEKVYLINPTNEVGKNYIKDEWQLDLVDSKYIRYTSNVEKEKIIRNKVSGDKSRASIPLFKMVTDKGYGYRNADYWKNVDNPINSLELDNVEGSVDGKLIYVPITRYTIDHEGFDLDRVYKMSKAVRRVAEDETDQKTFELFGVRKSDVKKLDSSVWVSFFDFYLDICKKVITSDLELSESAYKKFILEDNPSVKLHDYRYDFGKLFSNKTFDTSSLSEDHLVVQGIKDWEAYLADSVPQKITNAINYIIKHDESWLPNTFGKYDGKEIQKTFHSIIAKYPLLRIIAEDCCPHWGKLNRDDSKITNKMILDYISLCDGVEA